MVKSSFFVRNNSGPAPDSVVREILIALPDSIPDLYGMHQQIWSHVERAVRPGFRPNFLYRVEKGVAKVRSRDFQRGCIRSFKPGRCSLDLVAVTRSLSGECPVAHADLVDWASQKIAGCGFIVNDLVIDEYNFQYGRKVLSSNRGSHNIALPVAKLSLQLDVADKNLAHQSWIDGLGRGRRFGFGMICN